MDCEYKGRVIQIGNRKYVSDAFVISTGNGYRRNELIKGLCQQEGYTLVSEQRLSVYAAFSQDSRYKPVARTLFWDVLVFIIDFPDLDALLTRRAVSKEVLQFIDFNLDQIWRITVMTNHRRKKEVLIRKPANIKQYLTQFSNYYGRKQPCNVIIHSDYKQSIWDWLLSFELISAMLEALLG